MTIRVGRGFNSATAANDIAELFAKIEKPIRVFYLGDHDPSGRCIEKEMFERLLRYGSGHFKMERIAIHARDIIRFNLPPLRIKDKDPRQHSFRQRFGEDCVELDALPVTVLRQRVREAIEKQMEPVAWKRAIEVEQVEQVSIRSLLSNWPTHLRENQPGEQI